MKRIKFDYIGLPEKPVGDKEDFYKSGLKEATKIRSIIYTAQRLFVTQNRNVYLSIVGDSTYKIEIYGSGTKKSLISILYYIPKEQRLDLYDGYNLDSPMFVWSGKQCVIKNIGPTLEALKIETQFLPLVAYL